MRPILASRETAQLFPSIISKDAWEPFFEGSNQLQYEGLPGSGRNANDQSLMPVSIVGLVPTGVHPCGEDHVCTLGSVSFRLLHHR